MASGLEIIGAVGGSLGAAGGLGSLAAGVWVRRRLDRADERARLAEERASRAEEYAHEIAETSLRMERDRQHRDLRPPQPPPIETVVRQDPYSADLRGLFGSITVPRDYRVRIDAINGPSSARVNTDLLVQAEQPYEFEIEKWPQDRTEPMAKELWVRFWPPAEVDKVEHWTCPCDRPSSYGDGSGPGHWEWHVPIKYRDRRPFVL